MTRMQHKSILSRNSFFSSFHSYCNPNFCLFLLRIIFSKCNEIEKKMKRRPEKWLETWRCIFDAWNDEAMILVCWKGGFCQRHLPSLSLCNFQSSSEMWIITFASAIVISRVRHSPLLSLPLPLFLAVCLFVAIHMIRRRANRSFFLFPHLLSLLFICHFILISF